MIKVKSEHSMVELIWDGKYDSNGKRTAPPRLKLFFENSGVFVYSLSRVRQAQAYG